MKVFLTLLAMLLTTMLPAQNLNLDFSDSVSVKHYISTHSVCDQIDATIQNKYAVVDNFNCGRLLIQSISKRSKCALFIPIGALGITYSNIQRGDDLEEQLIEIKCVMNCSGSTQSSQ